MSSGSLFIRKAEPRDIESARRVLADAFSEDEGFYADNVKYANCINLVAESSGQVVGYTSLLLDSSIAYGKQAWRKYSLYVGVVAVDQIHRKKGVARKLLRTVAAQARALRPNVTEVTLHTRPVNVTIFDRIGFSVVGDDGKYPDGELANVMKCPVEALATAERCGFCGSSVTWTDSCAECANKQCGHKELPDCTCRGCEEERLEGNVFVIPIEFLPTQKDF